VAHATDLDLTTKDITGLASADAIVSFLSKLGYKTDVRTSLTPEAVGLSGDSAATIKTVELVSEDEDQFLRVVFAQPKTLTAKVRNDLVRVLGKGIQDHLLILASDFETLEFVLLEKRKTERSGPSGVPRIQIVPRVISLSRRYPSRSDLQTLRRFTWTGRDGLDQFDKLRSAFDHATYAGKYFQNRGLFSDHYLEDRHCLRSDRVWGDNPSSIFLAVQQQLKDAQTRFQHKGKQVIREGLLEPLFHRLGFEPVVHRPSNTDQTQPDYLLKDGSGNTLTAAFVYPWDRWLDGPDIHDADTPEENPGACVVSALDDGLADWIIVTNGRFWRLYSRHAHARATNFYEVDLVEALNATGETDPNEAFRYFYCIHQRPLVDVTGPPKKSCNLLHPYVHYYRPDG